MDCKLCGAKNIAPSFGGADICGACDCGYKPCPRCAELENRLGLEDEIRRALVREDIAFRKQLSVKSKLYAMKDGCDADFPKCREALIQIERVNVDKIYEIISLSCASQLKVMEYNTAEDALQDCKDLAQAIVEYIKNGKNDK